MVMLSLAPVNEIKLVALVVLLAAALLTGPVTGLVLGWRHGRLGRLAGSALGLAVGVAAVIVIAVMVEEPSRTEMVLRGPGDAVTLSPGDPGVEVRYSFPIDGPLHGRVTLVWVLLSPIRVGAAMVCAWFVTTRLWSLGQVVSRFVVRSY